MALTITGTANTAFCSKSRNTANSTTTSNGTYVAASNFASIASVPNNYMCVLSAEVQKSVGGTGSVRIFDGTSTVVERTGVTTSAIAVIISAAQVSGGTATISVQIKSDSDANTFTIFGGSGANNASQLACARYIAIVPVVNTDFVYRIKASCTTLKWVWTCVDESTAATIWCNGQATTSITTSTTANSINLATSIDEIHFGSTSLLNSSLVIAFDITGTLPTYT